MDGSSTVSDRLQKYMSAQFDDGNPRIVDLARIGVGRSRENWVFDLMTDGGERDPLILRSDPDGGLVDTDRGAEFALLRALEASPLPTPRARWLDADGTWLGSPSMIMQRAPGVTDYRVLNSDRPLAVRQDLARQFCDLLAQVHETDWRGLGIGDLMPDPGERAALHELDRWVQILRADQLEAYPELELAIDRLRESAPRSARTVLVHADFKPGNVLLVDDRVVALLDWELAHLGDPLEDLGWVTQPLRAVEHTIAGTWEPADLLEHYAHTTGSGVDPTSLAWWVAFSTFKTVVMQVSGLRSFLEARSDEPYRPTRRVLRTLLAAITDGSS
ncbi:Predicted kinase, aminoglycoside phosphotransferase (APT) family [Modestobacter sp. DSM 44400]|uniref:phosphotransferase family protein n=1 Tax=Modestobacter sp. DSM 44400 TaxID=1550230 RepID=UPI00089A7CBF|nr:phosphotransferase family protein [Modestobacter sp. DSM 44400]SDX99948.1 Predicted kinase, aminoglycoside phosphotransferase (APT) family [Modestobacter sp. DSM 44400]